MNVSINSAFEIALQTAASLYEGMPAKLLLVVVLGVLCFAGYRLLHWASALYGALAGVCLGVGLTGVLGSLNVTNGGLALSSAAMLVLGIVLGVIAYRVTHIGVFLACGVIGALVGYVPGAFAGEAFKGGFVLVLLVCFVLFGVTGILFHEQAYVIATGLSGIPAGIILAQMVGIASVPVQLLLGVILTVAGLAVQIILSRRAAEKLRQAEEAMQDTDPHLPIQQEPEEPDTIDTISDTVARRIDLSAPTIPPFLFAEQSEEPEEADDRTMAISNPDMPQEPDEPEEADTRTMVLPQTDIQQETEVKTQEKPVEKRKKRSIFEVFSEEDSGEQPEEADTRTMVLPQTDVQQEIEVKTQEKPAEEHKKRSIFEIFSEEDSGEQPAEEESNPVLAEEKSAEKFSLEALLTACDDDTNRVKRAEEPKQENEAEEKTKKPELTPEQKEQRKQNALTVTFAVVIAAASIVFAALGVQHVEVLLALCFCMYLAERYRLAAFGFAVLAVRRLYDAIVFLMQGGQLLEAMTDAVIGATFIILTLHMLRTYTNNKNQTEDKEESQDA